MINIFMEENHNEAVRQCWHNNNHFLSTTHGGSAIHIYQYDIKADTHSTINFSFLK
jgi:hypothetical protein